MAFGIGVVAFVVIMAFAGYHRGFIKIVLSFVAVAVALCVSYLVTPSLVTAVQKTELYENVKEPVYDVIKDGILDLESIKTGELEAAVLERKDAQNILEELGLPESIIGLVSDAIDETGISKLTGTVFAEVVAESLVECIFYAGLFILCFIILMVVLKLIISLCDVVSKLPVINSCNKVLGLILGAAEAVLVLWLVCLALTALGGIEQGREILEAVTENPISNFIYEHNPLSDWLFR